MESPVQILVGVTLFQTDDRARGRGLAVARQHQQSAPKETEYLSSYLLLYIAMNRLFSDSVRVGCAKVPSRNAVYGSVRIIAISSADIMSPPALPRIGAHET